MKNIYCAWDDFLDHLGEFFWHFDSEFLHEWLEDGKGFSNGRRLQSDIFEMNLCSRQKQLRFDEIWKLRHIFSHSTSLLIPSLPGGHDSTPSSWECIFRRNSLRHLLQFGTTFPVYTASTSPTIAKDSIMPPEAYQSMDFAASSIYLLTIQSTSDATPTFG